MNMKIFILLISLIPSTWASDKSSHTNFIIIFLDDAGWEDFQPFGKDHYLTPKVKQLADEGGVYSQFYVPQAVCSSSRAALLSGSYPGRNKVFGAHGPNGKGLPTQFATIAEQNRW